MAKKLTQEEYIKRLNLINDNIEIASPYIGSDKPIKLKCKIHKSNIWNVNKAGNALFVNHPCNICNN